MPPTNDSSTSPPTNRSSAGSRSARKPAAKRTAARAKAASTAPRQRTTAARGNSIPERAVLIPVGAALIARDRVVASVNDTLSTYSTPSKAQSRLNSQLSRFERRGVTARNRLEREVRKTRTRVERELRQRRRDGAELVDRLQERVLHLV